MGRHRDDRRMRRFRGDEGSVFVEAALVMPILALMVLGVMEYGLAWREANRLERTAAAAGRVGGTRANDGLADYDMLRTVDAALGAGHIDVTKVVLYEATGLGDTVPAGCLALSTGGVSDVCNVYNASQIGTSNPNTGFPGRLFTDPANCSGAWDVNYCPITDRERTRPLNDYIGVYIEATYEGVTGLIPGTITLSRDAVFAIEPCFEGDPNCV